MNKKTAETGKVVHKGAVARELLRRGHVIEDVKPDKFDPNHRASIFVFKMDDTLAADIWDITKDDYEARKNGLK